MLHEHDLKSKSGPSKNDIISLTTDVTWDKTMKFQEKNIKLLGIYFNISIIRFHTDICGFAVICLELKKKHSS